MGQQQSNDQMFSSTVLRVPPVNTMHLIVEGTDQRYGDVRITQAPDGQVYAIKKNVFQDQEAFNKFKAKCEAQIAAETSPFLIKMVGLQQSTVNEMCSTFISAQTVYEFYVHDLRKDIDEMRHEADPHYKEIEIVAFLHCMIEALITLQNQGSTHGDIRPSTVFMTGPSINKPHKESSSPNPIYKITNVTQLTQSNAYKKALVGSIDDGSPLLLSPEQLEELKQQSFRPTFDPFKSDLFSLGLVAIEMAVLKELHHLYNYEHRAISIQLLDNYIHIASKRYTSKLMKIIEHLLKFQPHDRPDLLQAQQLLQPYQTQLQDYFTTSTLNYSLTLEVPQQQQQQNNEQNEPQHQEQPIPYFHANQQENRFLPMPIAPQYNPPSAPSRPIHTSQASVNHEALHRMITDADQKAKQVLKKSLDAQTRYMSSPSGQYHNPDSRISQFDLYTKLPPITLTELLAYTPQMQYSPEDHFSQRESYQVNNYQMTPFSDKIGSVPRPDDSVQIRNSLSPAQKSNPRSLKQTQVQQRESIPHQSTALNPLSPSYRNPALHVLHKNEVHPVQNVHSSVVSNGSNNQANQPQGPIITASHQPITHQAHMSPKNKQNIFPHQEEQQYVSPTLYQQPTHKVLDQLPPHESHQHLNLYTYASVQNEKSDSPINRSPYNYKSKLRDSQDGSQNPQITLGKADNDLFNPSVGRPLSQSKVIDRAQSQISLPKSNAKSYQPKPTSLKGGIKPSNSSAKKRANANVTTGVKITASNKVKQNFKR